MKRIANYQNEVSFHESKKTRKMNNKEVTSRSIASSDGSSEEISRNLGQEDTLSCSTEETNSITLGSADTDSDLDSESSRYESDSFCEYSETEEDWIFNPISQKVYEKYERNRNAASNENRVTLIE